MSAASRDEARKNVQEIVRRMVEQRKAQGLSVLDVAIKMGVAPNTVRRFESLHSDPTLTMLMMYTQATNGRMTAEIVEHK